MGSHFETIDRIMNGDYSDASTEDRRKAVRDVIEVCSLSAAAVAVQPFPFVDAVLVSPIQIVMVQAIGRVHGHELDKKSVIEIISTLGASILAQNAMMAAAKFVPFAGWIAGMAMAYAMTYAIGEVADHYFLTGRGVSRSELRERFEEVYRAKREEKTAAHKSNDALKERLDKLKKARADGILDEEEFERKKREALEGF